MDVDFLSTSIEDVPATVSFGDASGSWHFMYFNAGFTASSFSTFFQLEAWDVSSTCAYHNKDDGFPSICTCTNSEEWRRLSRESGARPDGEVWGAAFKAPCSEIRRRSRVG